MENPKRIHMFFDNHIGFGIRWGNAYYPLELSFSFPFFSVVVGFGKFKYPRYDI